MSAIPSREALERTRPHLVVLTSSTDPARAKWAKRTLQWLEVLTAKTSAERHAAIRRLPVTIVRSVATDGRQGVIKSFLADGRVRVQLFVPSTPLPADRSETLELGEDASVDSPTIGRWKSDGQSGCYWDAEDDGPDQCNPQAGRWKLDGSSNCYWLDGDDGPNQCQPPTTITCHHEGQPSECATDQELEDVAIMAAQGEADLAAAEADYDAVAAELEVYCNENPWDCDEVAEPEVKEVSGPYSADTSCAGKACGEQAFNVTQGMVASAAALVGYHGAVKEAAAAGARMAGATTAAWYIAIGGAGFTLGYYIGSYIDCKIAKVQVPVVDQASLWSEPAAWQTVFRS
ncbi:MAG: hypothetical protein WD227_00715 [Vicinamibacterales bacterium]